MKKIPISDAKNISIKNDYDMVIVIGVNNDRSGSIATYGKNKQMCKMAGFIGQNCMAERLFSGDSFLNDLTEDQVKNIIIGA